VLIHQDHVNAKKKERQVTAWDIRVCPEIRCAIKGGRTFQEEFLLVWDGGLGKKAPDVGEERQKNPFPSREQLIILGHPEENG